MLINQEEITRVLLSDGNWYGVQRGTLYFDAYEFVDHEGQVVARHPDGRGFGFTYENEDEYDGESVEFFGPITELKAVAIDKPARKKAMA